jgi:DNA-binding CsgD family transcriptional regulator
MVESEKQKDVLTARELEILQLLIKGRRTTEIAIMLNITLNIVKIYRKKLINKLHVKNCAELAYKAFKDDLR